MDLEKLCAGGNVRLVKALAEHVPILYNTPAASVQYGSRGVCVTTADGRAIAADAAVVTVPLGVLKAEGLQFSPPLPVAKRQAIKRLGCALGRMLWHACRILQGC